MEALPKRDPKFLEGDEILNPIRQDILEAHYQEAEALKKKFMLVSTALKMKGETPNEWKFDPVNLTLFKDIAPVETPKEGEGNGANKTLDLPPREGASSDPPSSSE
ncbi:MAG: hypothetical protein COA82_03700 [Alkaliphilus sp.]|nr:MAG: hypothetical protein COA82_03700 [Alkaliphilus sp.]